MERDQELQLVGALGEMPFAREPINLGDGRTMFFLGKAENPSWIILREGEVLIATTISPQTFSWLGKRLDTPIPELKALQQPFAAVVNPTDTKINILQPNPVGTKLDTLTALEGSRVDEEGPNGRKADTRIILEQKAKAKENLEPLVNEAITRGQAVPIGPNVYVIPTTEAMLTTVTIDGDPASDNKRLRSAGPLVDPGTILIVQQSTDGNLTYLSPFVGKASGTDLPKLPIQNGETTLTLSQAIGNVSPTGVTATGIRRYLLGKLIADATAVYPGEQKFNQPEAFEINRATEEIVAGLPENLINYLETWARKTSPELQEELAGKRTPDGQVLIRELGELSEPVIEWILNASGKDGDTQFDRVVAEALSRRTLMERERAIKAAGVTYLTSRLTEGQTLEDIFQENYLRYLDEFSKMSPAELSSYVTTSAPDQLREVFSKILAKGKHTITPNDVAQTLASLALDAQIREAGIQYFDERLLENPLPDINRQRAVRRAERARQRQEILVTGGTPYDELLKPAIAALEEFGGQGALLYETPHTAAMRAKLEQVTYPEYAALAGRIPWRMIEGPLVLHNRERFETFGNAWSNASAIARDLYIGADYVMEKYGIAANSLLAQQITRVAEMVRATADWRMPDFLPRPTAENPGLPNPVMILRPDFARERAADGTIRWIATEGEASPGGLGFDVVIAAARAAEGTRSTVIDDFYNFLQTAETPEGVNKNRLTIVMTKEWDAYTKELEVFLSALHKQHADLQIDLVSIEELAEDATREVQSGFVFHFAYPWNFIKDPAISTDENRALHEQMAERANSLYSRQGKDLFIFNDPISGRILHGKMDMAIFHLPEFREVFEELIERSGSDTTQANSMGQTLLEMTVTTIPIVQNTSSNALNSYSAEALTVARSNKEKWVIKKSMDPNGEDDWGARGIVVGANVTDREWDEAIQQALESGLPWVLQRVIDNLPYDQPRERTSKDQILAGPIDADTTTQIAFYNRDPNNTVLGIGDLALEPSVKTRLNLFLFSANGQTVATTGNMTLAPSNGKAAQAVHGKTDAGEEIVIWA